MNVLMITGDKSFGPGHPRFELQKAAVDGLAVVFMGRGSWWPKVPAGNFDVVTAQDPFWRGLFAWHAARKLKAKFNVQVHTDLSVYKGVRRVLMRIVLRRAGSVRAVSEKIKSQVLTYAPRANVSVLPVFVDVPQFSSVIRRPHTGKNILWIGRFEQEKDPLEAIRIFKEVLKHVPDATLKMLGAGSLTQEAKSEAADTPVIEMLGWQNPLVYLDTADVLLVTSLHESWGASIVEALAAGVPVVAPDVGIAREAGAIVAPRGELAYEVVKVLQEGARGECKLELLTKEEWARAWRATLEA